MYPVYNKIETLDGIVQLWNEISDGEGRDFRASYGNK